MRGILKADITAEMLDLDDMDGRGGWPAHYVVGPIGSQVDVDGARGKYYAVSNFARDPQAYGFVPKSCVEIVKRDPVLDRAIDEGREIAKQYTASHGIEYVRIILRQIAATYHVELDDVIDGIIDADTKGA